MGVGREMESETIILSVSSVIPGTCRVYWVSTRAKVAEVTADAFRRAQTQKLAG